MDTEIGTNDSSLTVEKIPASEGKPEVRGEKKTETRERGKREEREIWREEGRNGRRCREGEREGEKRLTMSDNVVH